VDTSRLDLSSRFLCLIVHETAGADVDEAAFVLAALIALRGRVEELCELGGQKRSAAVLGRWRAASGGPAQDRRALDGPRHREGVA